MYWIALIALIVAAGFDLRTREIPDTIPVVLFLAALGAKLLGLHPVAWSGIALGAGAAFAVGAALFACRGLGGGDVKLLAALGAALGARAFLPFAVATGLLGGVVALVLRRRRGAELAYAPVMLGGLLSLLPLLWLGR
ncbi:MAG: prepilin peptidase [Planctomycetota bacterium]